MLEGESIWRGGILIDDRGFIERLVSEDDVATGLMSGMFNGVEVNKKEEK